MLDPIVYIDTSEILDGKLKELRVAMKHLSAFVEAKEPQLISYGFFVDENNHRMTVVAIHPDSASLEFHMEVGGPEFRKFKDLIRLSSIEVYGEIGDKVLGMLRQKAQTLGTGTVTVHHLHSGFVRFGSAR